MRCFPIALLAATATFAASLPEAAQRGDRAAARALVAARADVNMAQPDGTTALHWAAHQDDLELAQLLVRSGAQVKTTNRYGVSPLSLAATNGNGAMVALLLESGADANTILPGNETVLMTAARSGKVEAVQALLARGAAVNATESWNGQTALMWAAAENHANVIAVLAQAGADLKVRSRGGFTAFLFAAREGKIAAMTALAKAGADVNDVVKTAGPGRRTLGGSGPRDGTSALALAVLNAHFDAAAWLLDAGANPNANTPGYTPLHAITVVRKPGLGDNNPAPEGSGMMTSLQMVERLVKKGADINARMTKRVNFGLTSLNTLGATPFFLAAKGADSELMRFLAGLGADTKLGNVDNASPLIAAAGLGTRSPGEDAGTPDEVVEAVRTALDLGNDINHTDNNGETAMHGAAYKNVPGAVLLLAARGADPKVWNKPNRQGWTPLIIALGHRFGNFKPSPVTIDAFHQVMKEAGLEIPPPPKGRIGKGIY
ncbi:MAG: hypothetical protein FJW40_10480 [Acidobacteria bacterium]|nr:hypothetical protein [Acidobacteriota bacterium]